MMILDSLGLDLVHVLLGAGVGVWHDCRTQAIEGGHVECGRQCTMGQAPSHDAPL
jgi:hypothetical protein